MVSEELAERYELDQGQIRSFRAKGFVRLKDVLERRTLKRFEEHCTSAVDQASSESRNSKDDPYSRAFVHVMNVWTQDEVIEDLSFSKRLAEIAARLIGVAGVRISHDQALYKVSGGGATPIHADQYHWPVSNEKTVTAWIPFQDVPSAMGPLSFFETSHSLGSDLRMRLSTSEEEVVRKYFAGSTFPLMHECFNAGEVSFHYGWTFHRASANCTDRDRKAFAIVYMDEDIRLTEPQDGIPLKVRHGWCPGAKVGGKLDSDLNPVVYRST